MSDFFVVERQGLKKEFQQKQVDPVLYSDSNPEVYFLTDWYFYGKTLNDFKAIMRNRFPGLQYALLYCFPFRAEEKEMSKEVEKFFIRYSIDPKKYIKPGSKIVAMGRANYCITWETSMSPYCFYDTVWNTPRYFDSNTQCWVFPTDSFYIWFNTKDLKTGAPKDNFSRKFFLDQVKRVSEFDFIPKRQPKIPIELVEDPNSFLKDNMHQEKVFWDTETSGFDAFSDFVICITMSFDGTKAFYLPFEKIDINLLSDFFKGKYSIGSNLKFDIRFLYQKGVRNMKVDFDTLHAGHTLNEIRGNGLTAHSYIYTMYGGYDKPLKQYKVDNFNLKSYADIPESILMPYAGMDAAVGYKVYEAQKVHLAEDPELESYFYEYVMPTVDMFAEIELEGILIDWDRVDALSSELLNKAKEKEEEIYKAFGKFVNLNSKQDLGHFLEFKKKWIVIERGKEGYALTNDSVIQEWKKMGYKEAFLLEEHREILSQLNTFIGTTDAEANVEKEEDKSDSFFLNNSEYVRNKKDKKVKSNGMYQYKKHDRKVYPSYSVMLAKSHRHKCKNPNVQNIPKNNQYAKLIRSIFLSPSPEYKILSRDYEGLQLRIAAIMSEDESMINEFKYGDGDLHSVASQGVFAKDVPIEEFKKRVADGELKFKNYRRNGKFLNFRYLFGGGAYSFAQTTLKQEWTIDDCKEYIENKRTHSEPVQIFRNKDTKEIDYYLTVSYDMRESFFSKFEGLRRWHEDSFQLAKEQGYIRSPFGARRLFPELTYIGEDSDGGVVANLEHISLNSPVQNFEICVISKAMLRFRDYVKQNNLKSKLFVTVHDEIGYYVHRDEQFLYDKIREFMSTPLPQYKGVPITTDGNLADPYNKENPTYWGFGEPVE